MLSEGFVSLCTKLYFDLLRCLNRTRSQLDRRISHPVFTPFEITFSAFSFATPTFFPPGKFPRLCY